MRYKLSSIAALAATLFLIPVTGCDLFVEDLDNPSIDELQLNPTRVTVGAACTGLLIGNRRNRAQANGYIVQLGILGREAYNFDQADPRFIGELLEGPLQPGSPFGGNFWAAPYANVRLANIVESVADKVIDYSLAEVYAVTGFAKTIEATDLLEVAVTRDTNGGVIDTDRDVDGPLGAIIGRDQMLAEVGRLLDEGAMDLGKGGDSFPFELSSGYGRFGAPPSFLEYNRAMRARTAAYLKDYANVTSALAASFINDTPMSVTDLGVGVYHTYSTASGDQVNNLINPNIFAHPSFVADATVENMNRDERVARKTKTADKAGSARGLTSNIKYTLYTSPTSPVPIIRNEELLLLRAEAKFAMSDATGALADLNLVRVLSGGLQPIVGPLSQTGFEDALLYERRYSLAFEGHRWIDLRRFKKDLPLDKSEHVRNVRYPIPVAECDPRPDDEPACKLSSM